MIFFSNRQKEISIIPPLILFFLLSQFCVFSFSFFFCSFWFCVENFFIIDTLSLEMYREREYNRVRVAPSDSVGSAGSVPELVAAPVAASDTSPFYGGRTA